MTARARGPLVLRGGRARRPTFRSRTAIPGAPDQLALDGGARAAQALARVGAPPQGRPERQVRPPRARQPRHRRARRRARHAARVLRAGKPPAPRHGFARHAPPGREDDPLRGGGRQGRLADLLRPGERRDARPSTRPRTRTSPSSCTARCGRGSRRTRSCAHIYADIEIPVSRRAPRDGAQRRADRRGAPRAQGSELGTKMMALEAKAHELAGQPFNLGEPQAAGRDPLRRG